MYDIREYTALEAVARNRRHFPPDADIWHLRFHATERLTAMLSTVNAGRWVLSPLTLMHRQDGSRGAIWSAEDAVAITALTRVLAPRLPVSACCEHLAGHSGGARFVCRTRHPLRRAVRQLNQQLATLGFIKHPDKTFIGKISKGTAGWGSGWTTPASMLPRRGPSATCYRHCAGFMSRPGT